MRLILAIALAIPLGGSVPAVAQTTSPKGLLFDWSGKPGVFRVPGGYVIPGAVQVPGCGPAAGQSRCPDPVLIRNSAHGRFR